MWGLLGFIVTLIVVARFVGKRDFDNAQPKNLPCEHKPTGRWVNFPHELLEKEETIPSNTWYRQSHWKNKYFYRINTPHSRDWKVYKSDVPTAGITMEDREEKLLDIIGDKNFSISLEREQDNQASPYAIKVLGRTPKNTVHIGYVPDDIAENLICESEFSAKPYSVYFRHGDFDMGFHFAILVRSTAWLKRQTVV